jgi:hypothetical protein
VKHIYCPVFPDAGDFVKADRRQRGGEGKASGNCMAARALMEAMIRHIHK